MNNASPTIDKTIWDLDPHTKAKHEILKDYLAGWFPILSRFRGRIVYIDGFAGPGIYSKGEEGSPVIALRTACEHILKDYFNEIVFVFIESREDRAGKLREVLADKFPTLPSKISYEVFSGEFEEIISARLDELEQAGSKLAPTFAFIDPFGYTGFPMYLLKRILSYERCEVFITFMSGFIKRFLDEEKEGALTQLFDTDEWKGIRDVEGYRDESLLDLYKKQLRKVCRTQHVLSFEMVGPYNQPIYHLIFCTNHIKGLEIMKNAMWRVDKRGKYKFSDRLGPGQTFLFDDAGIWIAKAAHMVYSNFRGQTVPIETIQEYVIANTIFLYRSAIMQHIEKENPERIVSVDGRKRKNSFPDGCVVTFSV